MKEGDFSRRKVGPALDKLDKAWFIRVEIPYLRGIPDRIGCVNGKFVALETKKAKKEAFVDAGRVVLQRKIINKIVKAGGYAKFIYPENFDEVIEELKAL